MNFEFQYNRISVIRQISFDPPHRAVAKALWRVGDLPSPPAYRQAQTMKIINPPSPPFAKGGYENPFST
jgi:hypothetical protein